MRQRLIGLSFCFLLVTLFISCTSNSNIHFNDLVSQADKYNKKTVTLEAFYFDSFEMMALCESLQPSATTSGNLVPSGANIWINGGIPKEIQDQLYTQPMDAVSGYPQHWGRVKVTGVFESGGQFGHLGGYQYQITQSKVELVKWSPTPR